MYCHRAGLCWLFPSPDLQDDMNSAMLGLWLTVSNLVLHYALSWSACSTSVCCSTFFPESLSCFLRSCYCCYWNHPRGRHCCSLIHRQYLWTSWCGPYCWSSDGYNFQLEMIDSNYSSSSLNTVLIASDNRFFPLPRFIICSFLHQFPLKFSKWLLLCTFSASAFLHRCTSSLNQSSLYLCY